MEAGGWKITSLLISRKVLRASWPFLMVSLVESLRAWQAVMSGVYNGDPGFGFSSARYLRMSVVFRVVWGVRFSRLYWLGTYGLVVVHSLAYDPTPSLQSYSYPVYN